MVKHLEIMLDGPGIVFFDPFVLDAFVKEKGITKSDLFQLFIDEPIVGDEAIRQGIILPIYTIPPIDYQIIINNSSTSAVRPDWVRLTTPPFPLAIGSSGRLVGADIYSIMNWDASFYQKLPMDGPKAPQVAAEIPSSKYSVTIKGFVERNYTGRGPKNIGYELLFEKVEKLPFLPQKADVESVDFVLWQPGQDSA